MKSQISFSDALERELNVKLEGQVTDFYSEGFNMCPLKAHFSLLIFMFPIRNRA